MFNNQMKIVYGPSAELSSKPSIFAPSIKVDFNPASYKMQYANKYSCEQALHKAGTPMRFSRSEPSTLSLTFLFDGTGVNDFGAVHLLKGSLSSVKKKVEAFLEATTIPDGSVHEPPTVRLIWGDLDFRCKLTKVDINYKLFDGSGDPLRAELDATFKKHLTKEEWDKILNAQSPDVTHFRVLKAGESLPMLCNQIYGHSKYYMDVAKANRIKNFRDIQPGTKIVFPPLT